MMYRLFVLIISLALILSWSADLRAQGQKPAEPAQEPPPVLSVPKDYKYNARGRRDPFVNPVPPPVVEPGPKPPPTQADRPPGLPGVLVAEAMISGIVVSRDPSMTVVTITAPGGRRYFARIGDKLYDAVIKDITMNAVRFTVTDRDAGDTKAPREIVRRFGRAPGENK